MDFKINQQERDALKGLPHLARLTYLEALRPYMDYATGIVGIMRGISYQSLREELYVEPHVGYAGGSPSKQQMRRVIKTLARAGLISIFSEEKKLILKCELATWDYCTQNQVGTKPTHQGDTNPTSKNKFKTIDYNLIHTKADTSTTPQADTPPESVNYIIFLEKSFKKFWEIYPAKQSRTKAWETFSALSPTPELFQTIVRALEKQIAHYNLAKKRGLWMPNWKHANNWLTQQCWEDELFKTQPQGNNNARDQRHYAAKSQSSNLLWESCKNAFEQDEDTQDNVIEISTHRSRTC